MYFWFRFIYKYSGAIEIGNLSYVKNIVQRDYQTYSGKILLKYGTIYDEAKKFYGPIVVLDYGIDERKLKVEISNRNSPDHYEIKNLLGINVNVMTLPDMFAHKLCALLDRNTVASRDIFDSWFFMKNQTPVNRDIIEFRMKTPFTEYIQKCIHQLEKISDRGFTAGPGGNFES